MHQANFAVLRFMLIQWMAFLVPTDLLIHAIAMKRGGRTKLLPRWRPESVDQSGATQ